MTIERVTTIKKAYSFLRSCRNCVHSVSPVESITQQCAYHHEVHAAHVAITCRHYLECVCSHVDLDLSLENIAKQRKRLKANI